MTLKEPIKQFCAVTYDYQTYHFIIDEDNKIYCCEFLLETGADIIELKPNFVLRNKESETIYSLKDFIRQNKQNKITSADIKLETIPKVDEKTQSNLIGFYIIEPSVFEYMIENKMVLYSHDMALLYSLDPTYAYDCYFQTRAFKKKKNHKEKILSKQKKGIFQ